MNQFTSTTPTTTTTRCPTQNISIRLPLATVEELEHLAELNHITRQQLLSQLINASLLNDAPHLPAGEDPIERLTEHAYLTHQRSLELAAKSAER
jgi:hypothetical protein